MRESAPNGEKSFFKLFGILETVAAGREGLAGREISEKTGIPASTAFRMLKFLADRGYLRSAGGRYSLGPGLVRLGVLAQEQNPLRILAHPYLASLSEQTMETVHLAALRGTEVCYFDKVEGRRSVHMGSLVGNTSPLYCTGVGKAILAFLPRNERSALLDRIRLKPFTPGTIRTRAALEKELETIRRRGYAVDDCEHELGVYCVAAPVLDNAGNAAAGISISGSALYLRKKRTELAGLVCAAAGMISAAFCGR